MTKTQLVAYPVVVALLALAVTACGGQGSSHVAQLSTPPSSPASSTSARPSSPAAATRAEKMAASQCMRSHGIANFPNPIMIDGHLTVGFTPASHINPATPQFQAAWVYCGTRYLGLRMPSPAKIARQIAAALKFSACMRSHGLGDFPDPNKQGYIRLPSQNYFRSAKFGAANSACKALRTADVLISIPVM